MANMVKGIAPEHKPLLRFRQKILDYAADPSKRELEGRNGRLRLNSYRRTEAGWRHAGGFEGDPVLLKAFEAGAKWARSEERSASTPAESAEDFALRNLTRYKDREAVRAAFLSGVERQDIVTVFEAGSKQAERDFYKGMATDIPEAFRDGVYRAAFEAGQAWSLKALGPDGDPEDITPGPYRLEVRAELLGDLFRIERILPGFKTVTDSDLYWIRYHWEHDYGAGDLVDQVRAQVEKEAAA